MCAAKEDMKQKGDLLSANLYQLQKGDAVARVQNFYDPACPTVEIPLDVRLTPSQNAQRYYAKYRKASTAEKVLVEQIRNGEEHTRLHAVLAARDAGIVHAHLPRALRRYRS